jgi:hypothetical protein
LRGARATTLAVITTSSLPAPSDCRMASFPSTDGGALGAPRPHAAATTTSATAAAAFT